MWLKAANVRIIHKSGSQTKNVPASLNLTSQAVVVSAEKERIEGEGTGGLYDRDTSGTGSVDNKGRPVEGVRMGDEGQGEEGMRHR